MKLKKMLAVGFAVTAGALALVYIQRRKTGRSEVPNQALYHNLAPLYDRLFDATYARARKRAVALLDPRPGERLLISGVGTGLDLPQIPAGVQVTGVDISVEMLREAAKKSSPASVQLMQMDAQCLDFPEEHFDAALLNLIVSVAPDGRAVFQEAWRVLKTGGRLVLFDKFLPEGQFVSLPRAALGRLFLWIGTDINRKLSDVLGDLENGAIEIEEPSLFFGQYRILRFRKLPGGTSVGKIRLPLEQPATARQTIVEWMRGFNKRVTNRLTLRFAGKHVYAVIHHQGRKSGKAYQTPVLAMPSGDDFIMPLPYGQHVDWYRNLLAAGACQMEWRGQVYSLQSPRLIQPREALPAFPGWMRPLLRRTEAYLKMERASVAAVNSHESAPS